MTEHGPFRPNPDGITLSMNPYSWNRIANVIYLEAPIGVGFSYATNPAYTYHSTDNSTAYDNYAFLQGWFKKFPEYRTNDFYVTGGMFLLLILIPFFAFEDLHMVVETMFLTLSNSREISQLSTLFFSESYGGHYVPTLSNVILDKNLAGRDPKINMKGLMVGNPGTEGDWFYYRNEFAFVNFMFSHALIPQSNYSVAQKACGWNDFFEKCDGDWIHPGLSCENAVNAALTYVPQDVDLYGIYFPFCNDPSNAVEKGGLVASASEYVAGWNPLVSRFLPQMKYYPCLTNYMTTYMNLASVQAALHVVPTKWTWISSIMQYGPRYDSMVPLYKRFFKDAPQWRILVFSGDGDGAVPFLSTQRWIECLQRPILKDWTFWRHNNQVQGAYKTYDRLTMLTAKGCGHMLSMYCPEQGWVMFDRWINKIPF